MSANPGKIKMAAGALCWGCAVLSLISTAFWQRRLFHPVKIAVAAAAPEEPMPVARSAELERILQQRLDVLKRAAAWEESWDGEEDISSDAILNRPLLALRGVISSGGRQWAAVAVEGSARTVLAVPGQSLNGVRILAIGQTGMTCQWRGQKFFVPLE
ncbi:hypothetical protein FYJ74_04290 [Pyramidobacter sp. SM-530-WT-4B]|uniref:Uncharacterized protein n=1 Tax=Pyramidobacter porci TaxID=2605789 RepID=A0A6L5YB59_9BACT|nr:hypothetical protein [Pyramidobacter porci]MCI6260416.1 hypothetical protein [Pyramidobacter sp.]MDY2649202.1 hypothetical protein [Pyramidobacter porci]MST55258.1 hypothetical protein [Pyramidobacter porci]